MGKAKIVVIDYGLGNLTSVYNAFVFLDADVRVSSSRETIESVGKIVLPGVGAFQDAMKGLDERGLIEPLRECLSSGKIYLGICLGLQVLFETSEEGNREGLGVLKGKVRRFDETKGVKIPHIGWNSVDKLDKARDQRLTDGIEDGSYFYFDHSYYGKPDDEGIIAGTTEYGDRFGSFMAKDNIYAVQFHPERSQALGLRLLKNFIRL